jgi:hypothetical protein
MKMTDRQRSPVTRQALAQPLGRLFGLRLYAVQELSKRKHGRPIMASVQVILKEYSPVLEIDRHVEPIELERLRCLAWSRVT